MDDGDDDDAAAAARRRSEEEDAGRKNQPWLPWDPLNPEPILALLIVLQAPTAAPNP